MVINITGDVNEAYLGKNRTLRAMMPAMSLVIG